MVTTHLRIAAGVCALSIGLLVGGGGAVALADGTDAGGSSTGNQDGTIAGGPGTPPTDGPTSAIGNQRADEEPGQNVTKLNVTKLAVSVADPIDGQGPTSTMEAQTYSSGDAQEGTGTGGSKSGEGAGTTPSTESKTAPSESAPPASGSNVAPPAPPVPASVASPPTPAPTVAAGPVPPPPPMAVTTTVVAPAPKRFVKFARALDRVQATLAALQTSRTPVTDFINMLSAMADAGAALAQMPNDLSTLLGIPPSPSLIGGGGALDTAARATKDAPLFGPQTSRRPQMPVVAKEAPLFGTVVHPSNVGGVATSGLNQPLSLSGLAPVPAGVSPATRSFLDNVVSSVLVPASLTALAAIAVPGLGGLLIVCAAGVRIGYRQAKAAFAVRVAGIARFAGPGPLGVVRSGSLITLHPRIARVDRPRAASAFRTKTARATPQLEKVA